MIAAVTAALRRMAGWLDSIPYSLVVLPARLFPALIFWRAGRTKMAGWQVSDTALFLFREEYRVPLLPPDLAASLAAGAEHLFPVLLLIGLASRLAAAGLLVMTLVIQLFVYPEDWPTHGPWAACLLLVFARGPGALSLDHLLFGARQRPAGS